jgi:predicted methyltransferase
MRRLAIVGLALLSSPVPAAAPNPIAAAIAAAIAAPDRPKADTDRDADRKPAELLAFAAVKPGARIADIMPGQGYFTRLFSHVAGRTGHVDALVPAELARVAPDLADNARALAAAYANVTTTRAPTTTLATTEPVDLAWTSDNYHDLYAFYGPDKAAQFDAAVFRMLRPGGTFIVIDHAAASGAAASTIRQLHRIDPAIVTAQVVAAGFVLEAESNILRNAADRHDQPVFAPSIRGHTDQFVLKFRKPR